MNRDMLGHSPGLKPGGQEDPFLCEIGELRWEITLESLRQINTHNVICF